VRKKYESSEKGEMVMTKVLRIFALLTAASMLLWIAGCGGDDDDDECADNAAPEVTLSPNGGDIFSNTVIKVSCNKAVDSVDVSGGVTATGSGKEWTFSLAEGAGQSVTVTATDACGDTGQASATFNVGAQDTEAPTIVDGDCEPENGATGVDPADVTEEIIIVFSEVMGEVTVESMEPEINISDDLDGDTLTISFLGGASLGNETEVVIELSGEDAAGNALEDDEYTFTTMAKE
jgi:hypothetical protein